MSKEASILYNRELHAGEPGSGASSLLTYPYYALNFRAGSPEFFFLNIFFCEGAPAEKILKRKYSGAGIGWRLGMATPELSFIFGINLQKNQLYMTSQTYPFSPLSTGSISSYRYISPSTGCPIRFPISSIISSVAFLMAALSFSFPS